MIFVNSNILLDILTDDERWRPWSFANLENARLQGAPLISEIVYAEVSIGFRHVEIMDEFLNEVRIEVTPTPRAALFLAGKVYQQYRKAGGTKTGVLPDFFIGAQATVLGATLLTRDTARYRSYFPQLRLIAP